MRRARIAEIVRQFHENGLKTQLQHPGNVRELLQVLDVAILPHIDFAGMGVDSSHFVQRDYRHLESDLVLHAPLRAAPGRRGRRITIYILIEHQSEPDAFMIFRVLEYVVAIYKRQLREWQAQHGSTEGFRFQPVLPIVLYSGTRTWEGLGRLVDLVEQGTEFTAVIPALEPLFLNVPQTGADLEGRGGLFGRVLRLVQRRRVTLAKFEPLLGEAVREMERLPDRERGRWLDLLSYILALVYHERDPGEHEALEERIEASVETDAHRREVFDMAQTIAEMLIEKGQKQGEEKGRREGAEQALQEALLRQLRKRFGKVPAKVVRRIEATSSVSQLQIWLDQFATAKELSNIDIPPLD